MYLVATGKTTTDGVSFHRFPKDLLKVWEKALNRKNFKVSKHSVVCSIHFKESDFEVDYKHQLLGVKKSRRLKKGAVPSLKLRGESSPLCAGTSSTATPDGSVASTTKTPRKWRYAELREEAEQAAEMQFLLDIRKAEVSRAYFKTKYNY